MRLRVTLQRVAALALSAGCSQALTSTPSDPGPDAKSGAARDGSIASAGDVAETEASTVPDDDGSRASVTDGDAAPPSASGDGASDGDASDCTFVYNVAADVACEIETETGYSGCAAACNAPGACAWAYCVITDSQYLSQFTGSRADASFACPGYAGTVAVSCMGWAGRLTEGIETPTHAEPGDGLGALFAGRTYLEAASVFAFERLERELLAHHAPPSLVRDARRARRDEVRHTAIQARLARRHGSRPSVPRAPATTDPRSLFELALENAVEGCVRETYGAAAGLVEASRSTEPRFRRTMRAIADDECRHAELAWAIRQWARRRLAESENRRIDDAMRVAIDEIRLADSGHG